MARLIGDARAAVAPPTFGDVTIYLAQDPVDFRLGINGLSVLVEATLRFDPFSRNLFCFVNKRRNQIKVLWRQKSGFCLWRKRLEEERFKWPTHLPVCGACHADDRSSASPASWGQGSSGFAASMPSSRCRHASTRYSAASQAFSSCAAIRR